FYEFASFALLPKAFRHGSRSSLQIEKLHQLCRHGFRLDHVGVNASKCGGTLLPDAFDFAANRYREHYVYHFGVFRPRLQ
ncbi:MAG TPA: hypothetical protein VG498_06785, partial [Terriglobales bacterium]|nr:hypothetical protein [Terriglobales bacterium]